MARYLFQRFLHIAIQGNAQVIEFANISRESAVPSSTTQRVGAGLDCSTPARSGTAKYDLACTVDPVQPDALLGQSGDAQARHAD